MFGSEIVATVVYQKLAGDSVIQDTVSDRLAGIEIVPQGMGLPAGLFHPTSSNYGGTISGAASSESIGYTVKFVCEGTSTNPIWNAAQRQMELLDGHIFTVEVSGEHYAISFTASGEAIPTTVYESGTYYRLLGTSYDVQITRG